jgi:hypothetical protein
MSTQEDELERFREALFAIYCLATPGTRVFELAREALYGTR